MVTVGRPRAPGLASAMEEYRRRLSRWEAVEWVVVPEARGRAGSDPDGIRRWEGAHVLAALKPRDWVVALAVEGVEDDSFAFARRLESWRATGRPVALVVGGAFGLDRRVLDRADWQWSLSRLTLAHEVAQLVALEQLYRAFTILTGHPYHKG
ncbi:MAG: 23S rRNA (pseudouridine(1915)-N(3))-methyltransferase RlmH [Firmicutes bacterium]|nr:23S rRNA (pseudouridine(1915)-N(3))-methyltransferase RlmH [Alicyclobacillaceae bacterium]MCL6496162.1 23S rRNA (pseudouridine(1915)-N(3))-methyltransferase RlmH [Bacillota bacterium]